MRPWLRLLAVTLLAVDEARADDGLAPVIVGKDDWLYIRHEIPVADAAERAVQSIGLIERFNRVLSREGIALAIVLAPSKIETHPEHLPDDFTIPPHMRAFR